jgi:hypothetical protein
VVIDVVEAALDISALDTPLTAVQGMAGSPFVATNDESNFA